MSISASLSEARTPKANTEGKRRLGGTYTEMGDHKDRENRLQRSGQQSRTRMAVFQKCILEIPSGHS